MADPVEPGSVRPADQPGQHDTVVTPGPPKDPATREVHRVGRYEILSKIGQGGGGVVFRAFDPKLQRSIALKLVISSDPRARERLLREAQALAQLAHPNVVAVHDVGMLDHAVFMAMEWVDGVNLRDWLAAEKRSTKEILAAFLAAGEGLAAAHAVEIVHRDFKPSNVVVGVDGRIRVVDFGLAQSHPASNPSEPNVVPLPFRSNDTEKTDRADRTDTSGGPGESKSGVCTTNDRLWLGSQLTRVGAVVGTPRFMSPEQRRGAVVDARTDQFSFCVALYDALFGAHPYGSREQRRHGFKPTPDAPLKRAGVSSGASRALMRGLALDPDQRFPHMAQLLSAIRDERRAARRRVVAGIGLMVLSATGAWAAQPPQPLCEGGKERVESVWSPTHRVRLQTALRAAAPSGSDEGNQHWLGVLDEYFEQWASFRTETCRATRVHKEQSELVMDRKMACLDDRLAQASAFLQALEAEPTATAIANAPLQFERVAGLSPCRDADALARRAREPIPPSEQETVEALEGSIRRLRAWVALGNREQIAALTGDVRKQAVSISHKTTRARAFEVLGQALYAMGKLADAKEAMDRALVLATESDQPAVVAATWSRLFWIMNTEQRNFSVTKELIRAVELALIEARNEPEYERLEPEVGNTIASFFMLSGDLAAAEQRFREILARAPAAHCADSLNNFGVLLTYRARFDEARDALEASEREYRRRIGPSHGIMSDITLNRGLSHDWQGDLSTAVTHYRQALTHAQRTKGEDHPRTHLFRLYLSRALGRMGQSDEALAVLKPAQAGLTNLLGSDAELSLVARTQRAELELGRGQLKQARRFIDGVVDALPPDATERPMLGHVHPLEIQGRVALAEGNLDEAQQRLDQVVAMYARLYGDHNPMLAMANLGQAEVHMARDDFVGAREILGDVLSALDRTDCAPADPRRARAQALLAQAEAALK